MKRIIFIISVTILALFVGTACKTRKTDSPKVSATTENNAAEAGSNLVEKHWRLIELFGNPVPANENSANEAHIIFHIEDNRFSGNAGCNRIAGTYELKGSDRITFSQAIATRMMCINGMETEDQFLQVINTADSYIVKNDTLTLNRARMAPLARFVAVDEK